VKSTNHEALHYAVSSILLLFSLLSLENSARFDSVFTSLDFSTNGAQRRYRKPNYIFSMHHFKGVLNSSESNLLASSCLSVCPIGYPCIYPRHTIGFRWVDFLERFTTEFHWNPVTKTQLWLKYEEGNRKFIRRSKFLSPSQKHSLSYQLVSHINAQIVTVEIRTLHVSYKLGNCDLKLNPTIIKYLESLKWKLYINTELHTADL
jgi:hypothetical protein